jgi:hypothetical protein
MPNLGVFNWPLRGLNDRGVPQEILADLVSPPREPNVSNRADYEYEDERADANPLEPFFHFSLPLRF